LPSTPDLCGYWHSLNSSELTKADFITAAIYLFSVVLNALNRAGGRARTFAETTMSPRRAMVVACGYIEKGAENETGIYTGYSRKALSLLFCVMNELLTD
jgi:hypothetical protein